MNGNFTACIGKAFINRLFSWDGISTFLRSAGSNAHLLGSTFALAVCHKAFTASLAAVAATKDEPKASYRFRDRFCRGFFVLYNHCAFLDFAILSGKQWQAPHSRVVLRIPWVCERSPDVGTAIDKGGGVDRLFNRLRSALCRLFCVASVSDLAWTDTSDDSFHCEARTVPYRQTGTRLLYRRAFAVCGAGCLRFDF